MKTIKTNLGIITIYPNSIELEKYPNTKMKLKKIELRDGEITYKLDDTTAIRIFTNTVEAKIIDKKIISELESLPTKRIITPEKPIIDEEEKIIGHTMKYVYNPNVEEILTKPPVQKLYDLKKNELCESLSEIKEDLELIGKNNILVNGISESNYIINDKGLYIFNCGDYHNRKINMEQKNLEMFNEFFKDEILLSLLKYFSPEKEFGNNLNLLQSLYDDMKNKNYLYIGDYLKDNMQDNENIYDFIKRQKLSIKIKTNNIQQEKNSFEEFINDDLLINLINYLSESNNSNINLDLAKKIFNDMHKQGYTKLEDYLINNMDILNPTTEKILKK